MEDFSYLHIALRGELKGVTRTLYSFGKDTDGINPDWDHKMVEPGAAMSRFLNAADCYVLQSDAVRGHYFSYMVPVASGQDREYRMICILIDNGCSLTGRQLNNAFASLKKVLIDDERLDDVTVREALREAEVPAEPVRLSSWRVKEPDKSIKLSEAAYRTYISQNDLETILSFPAQPDYEAYRCILVVAATTSLRPGVKMPRITVPIRRIYSVVCPEGVRASDDQVYDGDTLTITYEREGFNRHSEQITVGQPSSFTKYEGSTIAVRTATQTGIRFVRWVPINVISAKGPAISNFTLTVNGRFVPTVEPVIEFSEKDLTTDPEVEIAVTSTNFKPLKVKKSVDELLTTDLLTLTMQPVEQGFTLRLDFGDGRVFEQQISLEKNTPEYTRLHSGYFHGFRAMRQATDDDTEIYNVDVRPGAPRVGVGTTSAIGKPSGKNAPVFENVSEEDAEEASRPEIDTSLPTIDTNIADDERGFDDYDDPDEGINSRSKWIKWALGAAAVIVIIVCCVLFLPRGIKFDVTPAEGTPQGASSGEQTEAAAAPAPLTAEEQADVDYLNSNPIWKPEAVSTPGATALMKAITDGDIDGIVNNDYFTVEGRCTNREADRLAGQVWVAKGSGSEKGNVRYLRGALKNGEIDLHKLNENLARVRPADGANNAPRPKK